MSKIGRPKTMSDRRQVSLTSHLVEAIDQFRFSNRIRTDSEAIRRLIELGLEKASEQLGQEKAS